MPSYKLQKDHTHAGKEYPAGTVLEVREDLAKRHQAIFGDPLPQTPAESDKPSATADKPAADAKPTAKSKEG
jgi:hypothetical protein